MSVAIDLSGQVAVVTGAAGGIGSATAKMLADAGARLALIDLDESRVAEVAKELQIDAVSECWSCDVRSAQAVNQTINEVGEKLGQIDILVNVAGGGTAQTINTLSAEDWASVMDLNLSGPFYCMQAAAPFMRKRGGGAVVTVGSLAAIQMSMNNGISYTAAKSGVMGLTRHAAFELSSDNIRVNAVLPGPTLTGQIKRKMAPERLTAVAEGLPLGRWVEPAEIAKAVLYFCSDLSSGSTGAHVVVDSGMHIGAPMTKQEYFEFRDRVQK